MEYGDIWRDVNIVLAVICVVLLVKQLVTYYHELGLRGRMFAQALIMYNITVIIGAVENQLQDNPPGYRTGSVTISCIWLIITLVSSMRDARRTPA